MGRSATRPGPRVSTADRAGALSGVAYVALIMIGNAIATGGGSQPARPTGQALIADLDRASHSTAVHVGEGMEVLGFVALAFFLAWITAALRRAGGPAPWLATVPLVGGIATLAVKIGSVVPEAAMSSERATLTGQRAVLLNDLAGGGFVLSFLTFAILMVGLGASLLASRMLGAVWAWTALLAGLAGVAVIVTARTVDTTPVPFLLGLLWILLAGVRLAWRGPQRAAATTTDAAAPVPVGA